MTPARRTPSAAASASCRRRSGPPRTGQRRYVSSFLSPSRRSFPAYHLSASIDSIKLTTFTIHQRAFRQRKEGHIKKLEEQVRDYQLLSENYKAVQAENYQLRDYIINLQSRLIESQGDFPPAPSNINLQQPAGGPPPGSHQAGQEGGALNGENGASAAAAGAAGAGLGGAPTAPMAGAALSMLQGATDIKGERRDVDPALQRA